MLKLIDFFKACEWTDIPHRHMESWKYTPIQKLLDATFQTFDTEKKSYTIEKTSSEPMFVHLKRGDNTALSTFQQIRVCENAQAEIIFDYSSEDESVCFSNIITKIILEKNASLAIYKKQTLNHHSFCIESIQVQQAENSRFYSFTSDQGGALSRTDFVIHLNGICAKVDLFGIYKTGSEQIADHHSTIYHHVPRCDSQQHFRGIVNDKSRAIFNGKIVIEKDAQKSSTKQLNKNLLLSNHAEIDTKPELEIYADDVKATHGATVGQLDQQALFYLQTRGITLDEAKELLLEGFLDEVLLSIQNQKIFNLMKSRNESH